MFSIKPILVRFYHTGDIQTLSNINKLHTAARRLGISSQPSVRV